MSGLAAYNPPDGRPAPGAVALFKRSITEGTCTSVSQPITLDILNISIPTNLPDE